MPVSREELYRRIDTRFLAMMEEGLLDEVRALRARGDLDPDLPSLRSVGYRQLWEHIEGRCDLATAVSNAQRATRNLAKRQLTWAHADAAVQWLRGLEDQELVPIQGAVAAAIPVGTGAALC